MKPYVGWFDSEFSSNKTVIVKVGATIHRVMVYRGRPCFAGDAMPLHSLNGVRGRVVIVTFLDDQGGRCAAAVSDFDRTARPAPMPED